MGDLQLWHRLKAMAPGSEASREELCREELCRELGALEGLDEGLKVAHWGLLKGCVEHPCAEVRGAAMRALGGAAGYQAFKWLLKGMYDAEQAVRHEALESFRRSCMSDPARWYHALFHADPEMRRMAITHPPAYVERQSYLWLLPDRHNRDAVREALEPFPETGDALSMLLSMLEIEEITREEWMGWMQDLPWERQCGMLLHGLTGYRGYFRSSLEREPRALEAQLTAASMPPDRLDGLMSVVWSMLEKEPPTSPCARGARAWLQTLLRSARKGLLQYSEHERLAISIVRVSFHQWYWEPVPLALCAMLMPQLLLHPMLDLQLRKDTLALLAQGNRHTHEGILEDFLCGPLCYHGDGSLDLSAIGGLLHLLQGKPYHSLLRYIRRQDLCTAIQKSPRQAADLLSLPPQSGGERDLHHLLLGSLLSGPQAPTAEDFAHLALHLSIDRLLFLEELSSRDPALPFEVLGVLFRELNDDGGRSISERKRDKIADSLFEALSEDLPQALRTLLLAVPPSDALMEQWSLHSIAPLDEDPRPRPDFHWRQLFLQAQTSRVDGAFLLATELLLFLARHSTEEDFAAAALSLDKQELLQLLILEQRCLHFPYHTEQALGKALEDDEDPRILAWRSLLELPPPPPRPASVVQRGSVVKLSHSQADAIARASRSELPGALGICFRHPVKGLCRALLERTDRDPHVEIFAALLSCVDSPEQVGEVFQAFDDPTGEVFGDLDALMVSRCERMEQMPLLGSAWLHRWDAHLLAFERHVTSMSISLDELLRWALGLASPRLGLEVWSATRFMLQKWQWKKPDAIGEGLAQESCELLKKVLLAGLLADEEKLLPAALTASVREKLQCEAARILGLLFKVGAHGERLKALRKEVLPHLPSLSIDVRSDLGRWLHTRAPVLMRHYAPPPPAGHELLEQIAGLHDVEALKPFCLSHQANVAEEAACQMLLLEEEGARAMAELLCQGAAGVPLRTMASTMAMWPDAVDLSQLRDYARAPSTPPEARFQIGMALIERGESDDWQGILDAINQRETWLPTDDAVEEVPHLWFQDADWQQLQRFAPDLPTLARGLTTAPHHLAYSYALNLLLGLDAPEAADLDAMEAFLLCGHDRLLEYRYDVAQRLREHQRYTGLPLLFVQRYHIQSKDTRDDFFVDLPEDWVQTFIKAGFVAGSRHIKLKEMVMDLRFSGVDPEARQEACLFVLRQSPYEDLQQQALSQLKPTRTRKRLLRKLAETFAWGILRGRELTGKLFGIEMIGGDRFGYTRLSQPRIFINPLPILRQDRQGAEIVKALILHEFGHHMYHADEEGIETWAQADNEQLGKLLNLVSDEQLERNLRAKDQAFGNGLKVLAAHAFQHAERELPFDDLLMRLGPWAFAALSGQSSRAHSAKKGKASPDHPSSPMQAARKHGHVVIQIGQLLFDLEGQGMSFARFMRALRMGLGNRHQDPKVERALRLFRKKFRHSSMPEMLEIARSLRDIFGEEVKILEALSQDHSLGCSDQEVIGIGEGMTQEELKQEIEKILREGKSSPAKGGPPVRMINLASGEEFSTIETVIPLPADRIKHGEYAQRTQRWSQKMRQYLSKLGLGMVEQRKRLAGYRLDRGQLQSAVLRGDPRLLVTRQPRYTTDLFLGIIVDCSGSMDIDENIEKARLFATMLAEAAAPLKGIDARFWGFTDAVIYDAGTATRCAAHALEAGGGNNDAAALWHGVKHAMASPRKARLLVMISDGCPTECTVESLRSLVSRASERMGICCAQIALRSLDEICFPHYVEVLDQELDLAIHRFGAIIAQLVHKAIQR